MGFILLEMSDSDLEILVWNLLYLRDLIIILIQRLQQWLRKIPWWLPFLLLFHSWPTWINPFRKLNSSLCCQRCLWGKRNILASLWLQFLRVAFLFLWFALIFFRNSWGWLIVSLSSENNVRSERGRWSESLKNIVVFFHHSMDHEFILKVIHTSHLLGLVSAAFSISFDYAAYFTLIFRSWSLFSDNNIIYLTLWQEKRALTLQISL